MAKKKINLNNMHQAHGKDEERKSVQSLDQLWGDDGSSKYSTLDLNEYISNLAEMNKTDLQNHASKIGLVPIDSRELLVKRLVAEFKKHVNRYEKVRPQETKNSTLESKVKKLLSD